MPETDREFRLIIIIFIMFAQNHYFGGHYTIFSDTHTHQTYHVAEAWQHGSRLGSLLWVPTCGRRAAHILWNMLRLFRRPLHEVCLEIRVTMGISLLNLY